MRSCIYEGKVRHRRFKVRPHEFSYRLFMMFLDLDELPTVFTGRWFWSTRRIAPAWLRRADYLFEPSIPLRDEVSAIVQHETGKIPQGPIRMLTHLRYFGYNFNPLTLYYCYDKQDRFVEFVIAEVRNTPWGEKHCYVLHENLYGGASGKLHYRHAKTFHVSPFFEMAMEYEWSMLSPGEKLVTHIDATQDSEKAFDATLTLTRKPISTGSLMRALMLYPFMTVQVIALIHWQALRLWLKRIPYIPHPKTHTSIKQP